MKEKRLLKVEVYNCKLCPMMDIDNQNKSLSYHCKKIDKYIDKRIVEEGLISKYCPLEQK